MYQYLNCLFGIQMLVFLNVQNGHRKPSWLRAFIRHVEFVEVPHCAYFNSSSFFMAFFRNLDSRKSQIYQICISTLRANKCGYEDLFNHRTWQDVIRSMTLNMSVVKHI